MTRRKTPTTDMVRKFTATMNANLGVDEETRKALARSEYGQSAKTIDLAFELDAIRRAKDCLDDLTKYVNAYHDVMRMELVPEAMEREHIENIRIEDLGRLSLTPDLFVSVKADHKDDLRSWLTKRKLGDLIQETINSSTLKAYVIRAIKDGKEYPIDLLNVTPYTRASITKG